MIYSILANQEMVVVDAAPSLHTGATSRNWDQMLGKDEELPQSLSIVGPYGQ